MVTKTLANRPVGTQGNKRLIYRWVARGQSELIAVHIINTKGYIQRYRGNTAINPTHWQKDGAVESLDVRSLLNGTENPGSGYSHAELHSGANRVGWILLVTGGSAKPKNGPPVMLNGNRMRSRQLPRINRREHFRLVYRRHPSASAATSSCAARFTQEQQARILSQLQKLDLQQLNVETLERIWKAFSQVLGDSPCDTLPDDILLEEEEYLVDNTAVYTADDYFPAEYEYDYNFGMDMTDP